MFKWNYEASFEFDVPIVPLWEFSADPINWPQWIDLYESCQLDSINPRQVNAKIKNTQSSICIMIAESEPPTSFQYLVKTIFFSQSARTVFTEVSHNKTKVTSYITVSSLLTPFFQSYYRKQVEKQLKKSIEVINAKFNSGCREEIVCH